jgi:hypothetical protein
MGSGTLIGSLVLYLPASLDAVTRCVRELERPIGACHYPEYLGEILTHIRLANLAFLGR